MAEESFGNYADSLTKDKNIEREINARFILDFESTEYPAFKKKIVTKLIERINA